MKILYLSPWFPFPPTNGSELRINALLRGLAEHHDVTLISFQRRPVTEDNLHIARELLEDIHLVPWREFDPKSRRARLGFFDTRPRSVVDTYSAEMVGTIRRLVKTGRFNVIVVSQLVTAGYAEEFNNIPAIFEEVELGIYAQVAANPTGSKAGKIRNQLMWAKQRAYVNKLLPHFAACTIVSEQECALLREIAPNYDPVELIPNCINSSDYTTVQAAKEPDTLIFTGAFTYDVNYKAMVWFLEEVFPRVQQQVPATRLIITGDHAGKPLPTSDNVTLTGFIDDVKIAVARSTISIVPILQGGGTRLKVLEAMALGTPVVSTTKGAEGLDAVNGKHILLGDTPQEFADAVVKLMIDPALQLALANNARQLILKQYDWAVIMPRFLDLVEGVANRSQTARRFHASL